MVGLRLPLIHGSRRWPAFLLGYAGFSALYVLVGRLHWHTPILLPTSFIDRAVPFLDWTLLIYFSHYLLPVLALWLSPDDEERSRCFYAMVLASSTAFLIFALWPTMVSRPWNPGLMEGGHFQAMWAMLYAVDTPSNCLPSLHVALATLSAAALFRRGGFWKPLVCVWALAVSLSTLTTKQHLAIDAVTGLLLAVLVMSIAKRYIRFKA